MLRNEQFIASVKQNTCADVQINHLNKGPPYKLVM
jgi:hypothetical protein